MLALSTVGVARPVEISDSGEHLARVRVIVTTTSASASIAVDGVRLASFVPSVLDGPPALSVGRTGRTLRLSRNVAGQSADVQFDVVLADAAADSTVTWKLTADAGRETQIEVYSLRDLNRPAPVDRFGASGAGEFVSSPSLLGDSAVKLSPSVPRLVLAHYYPWYTIETWRDPQMADRPLQLYSTDQPPDVRREVEQAHAAGIDAFAVSWQGLEAGNGFNDKRMRILLDAAQGSGLQVCAYTETYVANPRNSGNDPIDPQTLFEWLADIVDRYGQHPAYLRVAGRPVIFTYAATLVSAADWNAVIGRLQSSGRLPFLIGDFSDSTLLDSFDGEYQYTNIFARDPLPDFYRNESLRVRTYNLLREGDRRRLWVAPVTPGFDDSHLVDRHPPRIIDRANGSVYVDEWKTAVDTGADWVIVTSWNEWWENSEIEASQRYGRAYLDLTTTWAKTFKFPSREVLPAHEP
jgi:glycosyl hydrolase family 99